MQEYGFTFDPARCLQCHACEIACKSWRGTGPGVKWRRVEAVWSGTFPQVGLASTSLACQHCVTPECIAVCPEEAISKRPDDGVVQVDPELCSGCRACLAACPFEAPCFGADGIMQKCDFCRPEGGVPDVTPACTATCPSGALQCGLKSVSAKKEEELRLEKNN